MALRMAAHVLSSLPELRLHPTEKRVRAFVDGETVIDTTGALVVWEPRRVVPSFAVPIRDIAAELTAGEGTPATEHSVKVGEGPPVLDPRTAFAFHTTDGTPYTIVTARPLPDAAFAPSDADFDGYAIVDFAAFDEWREEDEVLVGHARDPFKRIDTRRSSRRIVVEVGGVAVAESSSPTLLFETYLPTRYYLPRDDVRMELLEATDTTTACAYKGIAAYWSVKVGDTVVRDVAWTYAEPHHDALPVRDMVCFFNERVDLTVDGTRLERPITPWS